MDAVIEAGVVSIVLILGLAAAVAILTERLRIPYVVALAVLGAAFSPLLLGRLPKLDHQLILFVLLPGLLFEAGFALDWETLRKNLVLVAVMATIGVVLTTALVGAMAYFVLSLPLAAAALFGAAIAPTDPVAVVATFRRLGVPHRLANLIEAESLLNDGTGVVVFMIAFAAVGAGAFNAGSALLDFVRLAIGGLALGLLVGLGMSRITSRIQQAQALMSLTAVAAYGGYLLGEWLHVSGILVVVAAALVLGNYGRPAARPAQGEQSVDILWDYVAFVLNSAVFLLIGASTPWPALLAHLPLAVAGALIAVIARAIAVYGIVNLLRPFGQGIDVRWQHLLVWGGLRGAVALALVLGLSSREPRLETVQALVYGCVLASIAVQGLTIGPLTRRILPTPATR